jgi:hypothetical protein
MGGKVKTGRDASANSGSICRPASACWQKWGDDGSGVSVLRLEAAELSELKPAPCDLIAIPVRRAFSLCVWVPADDPTLFRDLVLTQLEMRGLAGRTREDTAFYWQEIARDGTEVLVQVTVLPVHLAARYWHGDVTDYAVSPAFLPLENDGVAIWNEQGAWVAAITRGDKLIHFQALAEPSAGASMALEVSMMLAPLEAGNMIDALPRVVFYRQEGDEIDLAAFNESGALSATVRDFPPPVRPAVPSGCVPLAVRELQVHKKKSAQQQRLAFAGAAVYLALVLLLAGQTLWLQWQARRLRAEIDRDAPAVQATKTAMDKWQALQPTLEPSTYALEILFQTSRLLPKDGVRLTLFEINLDRVLIQGEASTLAAAIKFQDDLKKNTELEVLYDWAPQAPKQLPNGSTRFQIDGTRRGSAGQSTNESSDI